MAGKALLNRVDRERLKHILILYLQMKDNLKDEQNRFKTYQQVCLDLRGLAKPRTIKKILREEFPELHKEFQTKHKAHHSKSY